MHVTAVIAEYNPFHNGHAWQLARARELTGADFLLVVMSGDFVQRGAPALFDKRTRARMALLGGADLVLELPPDTATGSAWYFARGAVSLLNALACVDTLCFGSEAGEIAPFHALARIFVQEPEAHRQLQQDLLKNGVPYPAARAEALAAYLEREPDERARIAADVPGAFPSSEGLRTFLSSPNNILGLEYVQALLETGSAIRPMTVPRIGSGYHEERLRGRCSSASAIREALRVGTPAEALAGTIPPEPFSLFREAFPLYEDDFSLLLGAKLLDTTPEELASFLDLTPDLARRICSLSGEFTSFRSFAALVKNRGVTYTRVSRALTHALLGIRSYAPPALARVLGFRRGAAPLLASLQERARIPLVRQPAKEERMLSPAASRQLTEITRASNLYGFVRAQKYGVPFQHEYQRALEIV